MSFAGQSASDGVAVGEVDRWMGEEKVNIRRRLYPRLKFWPFAIPVLLLAALTLIDAFLFQVFGWVAFPFSLMGSMALCLNSLLARLGRLSPEVEGVLSFLLDSEEFMSNKVIAGICAEKHQRYASESPSYYLRVKGVEVPLTKCEELLLGKIIEIRDKNISRLERRSALETSGEAIDALMRSQEIALTARLEALRAQIEQKGLDSSPRSPIMAATKETQ